MKKAAPGGDDQFKTAASTILKYLGGCACGGCGRWCWCCLLGLYSLPSRLHCCRWHPPLSHSLPASTNQPPNTKLQTPNPRTPTPQPPNPDPHQTSAGNVARAPEEDKFRRIPLGGAAFQSRVAVVPGAVALLELCGFQVGFRGWGSGGRAGFRGLRSKPELKLYSNGDSKVLPPTTPSLRSDHRLRQGQGDALYMPREAADVSALNAAGTEINNALTNPFFGAL